MEIATWITNNPIIGAIIAVATLISILSATIKFMALLPENVKKTQNKLATLYQKIPIIAQRFLSVLMLVIELLILIAYLIVQPPLTIWVVLLVGVIVFTLAIKIIYYPLLKMLGALVGNSQQTNGAILTAMSAFFEFQRIDLDMISRGFKESSPELAAKANDLLIGLEAKEKDLVKLIEKSDKRISDWDEKYKSL